ncbi:MAG: N-acetylmuramoyl-L-alanine amidase [bacterium]
MKRLIAKKLFCAILCSAFSLLAAPQAAAQSATSPEQSTEYQLILKNTGFTLAILNITPFSAVLTLPVQREFKTFTLNNPDRFVVDVLGAVMEGAAEGLDVGGDTVKKVRFGQFSRDPDVMRMVLDMNRPAEINARKDDNRIIFSQPDAKAFLPEPKIEKLNDRVVVTVPVGMPDGTTVEEVGGHFRVVIDVPGYAPKEALKEYPVNRGLVSGVRVSYYNDNPDTTRIIIDCKLRAEYKIEKKGGSFSISVIQPSVYGKTIAVDPGHGGKDEGTKSSDGDLEKDLNLVVAFKLAALLEAAGANVVMTRKNDVFVPLKDRAYIANRDRADVFVSVHANALERHSRRLDKRGTQTYYYHKGSIPLASAMQRNMTSSLGAGDLGMYKARFKVLRETRMRAVLCELAYMTHPDDSALLKVEEFRDNGARGIFNGLNEYFGGRGAMLPPLELPESALAYLPGPSPARVYAAEHGVSDLPTDLEIDTEEEAITEAHVPEFAETQPERLTVETVATPVSTGAAVEKGRPSRLEPQK